jgi:hypothetical protein
VVVPARGDRMEAVKNTINDMEDKEVVIHDLLYFGIYVG